MIKQFLFNLYSNFRTPSSTQQQKRNVDIDLVRLFFDKDIDGANSVYIDEQTADDLGINEIFLTINDTSSKIGEQYLYNTLRRPFTNIEELISQHNISENIEKNIDLKTALKANLNHINKYKDYYIFGFLKSGKFKKPNWFRFVAYSQTLAILSAIGSFFYLKFLLIFLPIFFFNFYVHYFTKQKYWDYFTTMARLSTLFQVSVALQKLIPQVDEEITSRIQYVKKFVLQSRFLKIVDSLQSTEVGQIVWLAIELISILFLIEVQYIYSLNERMENMELAFFLYIIM